MRREEAARLPCFRAFNILQGRRGPGMLIGRVLRAPRASGIDPSYKLFSFVSSWKEKNNKAQGCSATCQSKRPITAALVLCLGCLRYANYFTLNILPSNRAKGCKELCFVTQPKLHVAILSCKMTCAMRCEPSTCIWPRTSPEFTQKVFFTDLHSM